MLDDLFRAYLEANFEEGDLVSYLKDAGQKVRSGGWWMLSMCVPSAGEFLYTLLDGYADDDFRGNWDMYFVRIPALEMFGEVLAVLIIRRELLSYEDIVACGEDYGVDFPEDQAEAVQSFGALTVCSYDSSRFQIALERKVYSSLFSLAGLDPCEQCSLSEDECSERGCYDPEAESPAGSFDDFLLSWFSEN